MTKREHGVLTTRRRAGVEQDRMALGVSVAIMVMGLVVLAGWHAHLRAAILILGGASAMQYNTALCFVALGAAGAGLATGRRLPMIAGATFAGIMGVAVMFE